MGNTRIDKEANEVRFKEWNQYGKLSGVQHYPGFHLIWPLKARRSLFPDWPWLCDESSHVTTQKGSAHSCSNFGGKIQNGVPAKSWSLKGIPCSTDLSKLA